MFTFQTRQSLHWSFLLQGRVSFDSIVLIIITGVLSQRMWLLIIQLQAFALISGRKQEKDSRQGHGWEGEKSKCSAAFKVIKKRNVSRKCLKNWKLIICKALKLLFVVTGSHLCWEEGGRGRHPWVSAAERSGGSGHTWRKRSAGMINRVQLCFYLLSLEFIYSSISL